jgi:hypothetical protein
MTTTENINNDPRLFHCEDEDYDCTDPAHRIAAMYQTHNRVNVETYNADGEQIGVIGHLLKEEDALNVMLDWITIERDRGVKHDGPSIRVAL